MCEVFGSLVPLWATRGYEHHISEKASFWSSKVQGISQAEVLTKIGTAEAPAATIAACTSYNCGCATTGHSTNASRIAAVLERAFVL